jgi:hypothetical protein
MRQDTDVEVISFTLHAFPALRMSPGIRSQGKPLASAGMGWVAPVACHGHTFVGIPLKILAPDTRSIMLCEWSHPSVATIACLIRVNTGRPCLARACEAECGGTVW